MLISEGTGLPLSEGEPLPRRTLVEARAFPLPPEFPKPPPYDWSHFQQEYVLYAPGLMYAHVRLDRDPFLEFEAWHKCAIPRWRLTSPRPWFLGIGGGPFSWGHTLHVIPKKHEESWLGFLNSLGYWDRGTQVFIRLGIQTIQLWDPWKVGQGYPLRVACVALSTTRGQVVWGRPPGPGQPCSPRFLVADPELVDFAATFSRHVQCED